MAVQGVHPLHAIGVARQGDEVRDGDDLQALPQTFHALATAFLEDCGIVPDGSHVTPSADNQFEPRLVDTAMAGDWRFYHDARAVLRILEKGPHLQLGRGKRA